MAIITAEALSTSTKGFVSWAQEQGKPETLVFSFHVSADAAEKGAQKNYKKLDEPGRFVMRNWGWTEITESDRKYGHVV